MRVMRLTRASRGRSCKREEATTGLAPSPWPVSAGQSYGTSAARGIDFLRLAVML
jgi:hypothetical protein